MSYGIYVRPRHRGLEEGVVPDSESEFDDPWAIQGRANSPSPQFKGTTFCEGIATFGLKHVADTLCLGDRRHNARTYGAHMPVHHDDFSVGQLPHLVRSRSVRGHPVFASGIRRLA
jgi:hypothetical protein